jgi:prepilin-type N-terminal cleavage/methylation domain-containing protein
MMKKLLRFLNEKQSGFTAVEMVIGVVIIGLVGAALAVVITQTVSGNILTSDRMTAVNNVRNAVDWISQDARMVKNSIQTDVPGILMRIEWEDYAPPNGEPPFTYRVDYALTGTSLSRHYVVMEGPVITIDKNIMVAENITSIIPTFIGTELTVSITAAVNTASETRTFTINMRNIPQ